MRIRVRKSFFQNQSVCVVFGQLIGRGIIRKFNDGHEERFRISEIEMYMGEAVLASHASKGRIKRTEVMYSKGSCV